jgi:hypothetical protein
MFIRGMGSPRAAPALVNNMSPHGYLFVLAGHRADFRGKVTFCDDGDGCSRKTAQFAQF